MCWSAVDGIENGPCTALAQLDGCTCFALQHDRRHGTAADRTELSASPFTEILGVISRSDNCENNLK